MGGRKQERELTLLAKVDEGTIKRSIARMNDLSRGFNAVADAEVRLDRANAKAESSLGGVTGATRQSISELRKRFAVAQLDIRALRSQEQHLQKTLIAEDRLTKKRQESTQIIKSETSAIEQQNSTLAKSTGTRGRDRGSLDYRAGSISSATSATATLVATNALGDFSPELANQFRLIADITQVVEYLPRLSEALTGVQTGAITTTAGLKGLAISLGPIALVAAGAAAAYVLISKELEKGEKAAISAASVERQLAELRVGGSREAIDAAMEAARIEQAISKEQIRLAQERQAAILAEGDGVSLGEFREIEKTEKLIGEYNQKITDQQTIIDAVIELQQEYNDTIITQAEVTERILDTARERATLETELNRLAEEGTREDLDRRRKAVEEERDLIAAQIKELEPFAKVNKEVAAEIEKLREREAELAEESRALNHEILNAVSAREKELAAIEAQKEALDKAVAIEQARAEFEESLAALEAKTLAERKAIIQRTNDELIKIETRRLEQIDKLTRDFGTSEARAERDFNLNIEKMERESREQEESIKADSASRINDIEERAARERQRILEDYNDAASDAIQNRDAVALDAAVRTRNRALKDNDRDLKLGVKQEKAALKERLEEARRSNAQRIQDLRAAYAIERADRYADFQQRLSDINAQAEQERAVTQTRHAEALAALEARNREELAKIKAGFAEQLEEYDIFFTDLQNKTAAELLALAIKWETYFRRISMAGSTATGTGIANQPGANTGGVNPIRAARGIRGLRNGTLLAGEGGSPELMRVKNGAVDVLSGGSTRSVFNGMGRAMQQSMANVNTQRTLNIAAGAFQANMSGADPVRLALEVERRIAKRLPVLFEQMLEAELGNG